MHIESKTTQKNMPLVSIIVPVYNSESLLPRCVESLRNNSYDNIEIILIDDGSNDKSGKLCDNFAELDSRISVIHKENGGTAAARNAGISKATGAYIAFADQDDFVHKDFIYHMVSAMSGG